MLGGIDEQRYTSLQEHAARDCLLLALVVSPGARQKAGRALADK